MEIGEVRQASLWFKGKEQLLKAEKLIRHAFDSEEKEYNVKFSTLNLLVSDSTPEGMTPPEEGAKILLGEAIVVDTGFTRIETNHLLKGIARSDLRRMRIKTKKAWKKTYPDSPGLPTQEADNIIASSLFEHLRKGVH